LTAIEKAASVRRARGRLGDRIAWRVRPQRLLERGVERTADIRPAALKETCAERGAGLSVQPADPAAQPTMRRKAASS